MTKNLRSPNNQWKIKSENIGELIGAILQLWPQKIATSNRKPRGKDGCFLPTLTATYDEIEKVIDEGDTVVSRKNLTGDEYDVVRNVQWSIFQVLHDAGKRFEIVHPHEVSVDELKRRFEKSIEPLDGDDAWRDLRLKYYR